MKIGETVLLRPAQGATNRTKNRIRENGPVFIVSTSIKQMAFNFNKGAQVCILFESEAERASDGKGGKETWSGWLPLEEIKVENENR